MIASLLTAVLLLSPAPAAEPVSDPLVLAERAVEAHPDLAARRARVEELRALASVSRAWSDPMLGLAAMNLPVDSFALDRTPMSGVEVKLSQTLPAPGTKRLAGEAAEHRVEASEHAVDEAALALRGAVEATWWQIGLVRQLRAVTARHVGLTEELLEAVEARYEVGATGQHAVFRLQVLRDRLEDELADFDQREAELIAALRRATADPELAVAPPPEVDPLAMPDAREAWLERALEHRPLLVQIDTERQVEEASAALARARVIPDLTLFTAWRYREATASDPGTDFLTLGLSAPIPLASARVSRGRADAHLAAAQAAERRYEASLDMIRADLDTIEARWSRAAGKADTYTTVLLPEAERALDTTLSDYRVGKADFATLYQAEVTLLELERSLRAALVETHVQQARARAAIGADPAGDSP